MAKFEIAVLSDRLVKRETRDAIWTSRPQPPRPGSEHIGYAMGWGSGEVEGAADMDMTAANRERARSLW